MGKRGPKPTTFAKINICFTPDQIERMTQHAHIKRISRNSLIRDAVERYLKQECS